MNTKEIHCTSYSYSQQCVHHETLAEHMEHSLRAFANNKPQDDVILFASLNEAERDAFTPKIKDVRDAREIAGIVPKSQTFVEASL